MKPLVRASGLIVALVLALGAVATTPTPASAVDCVTGTALPTSSGLGSYVLQDNFESGDFRRWSRRVAEGDARAYVGTARRLDGACAGRLVVTSRWDSRGYVRKNLPADTRDVWLSGWFRVDAQGGSGSNVPTWRVFLGSRRIADVHRQNVSGDLWLRTTDGSGGWRYTKLGRRIGLGSWHRIALHVYANWSGSDIDVWVDGTNVYHNGNHWLPVGKLDHVLIGAEHRRQVMDLWFDGAVVRAR